MKTRGTLVLLATFFAGLIALWWADVSRIPSRAARERMSERVLPELIEAKPDDLQKIEILGGEETFVFVRRADGNGWQMTSPMDVEADPSKVETLAYNLKELSRKPDAATIEGDAKAFGLAPPERVIRLWGNKTSEPLASLDVGLESASLGRRYVRRSGFEGIELVDAKALALINLPKLRWRDSELFRVPSFEIDVITLKNQVNELEIKRGRDAWRLEKPIKVLAAEPKVEGLIADLGSLRVTSDTQFVADNVTAAKLEEYGLKTPALTIEVEAGRAGRRRPPQVLHVGKLVPGKQDQIYVMKAGQDDILSVDSRVLKDLKANANSYRSKKVADIKPALVSKIALEQSAGGFKVERRGNDWWIVEPSLQFTDKKVIEDFLKSLEKVETSLFASRSIISDSGLTEMSPVLKIWQRADPRDPAVEVLSLKLGRRDALRRAIYAQIEGDTTILALPENAAEFLPRNVLAFRDRRVLNESIEPIQRITLAGAKRKFVLNSPPLKIDPLHLRPMGWWLVDPIDAPADPPSVGALLRVISGLRAENLVAETAENLEVYGLKDPVLTLTWARLPQFSMLDNTPVPINPLGEVPLQERSLRVGGPVPGRSGSRFAKLSDRPLIFTIGAEVASILDSEWHDHQVVSFKPERVKKVRMDWSARSLTFIPANNSEKPGWEIEGRTSVTDLSTKELPELIKILSKLATTRFAQYQGGFPSFTGLESPRLTLRVELDDRSNPRTLRIGNSDGLGHVFATTEGSSSGAIFLLPESPWKPWFKPGELPDSVFAP